MSDPDVRIFTEESDNNELVSQYIDNNTPSDLFTLTTHLGIMTIFGTVKSRWIHNRIGLCK